MTSYIKPEEVTAPRYSWQLARVIIDGGEGAASWALGYWEGVPCIVTRWNGNKKRPSGMPFSRGPVWCVIDEGANDALIAYLAGARKDQAAFIREFFRERHCDRPERGQRWCIHSDATLCTFPDCECPPRVASIRKGE